MTREICLDTETTGLDPKTGDRIVEIACVEIINKVRTGKFFHVYINPERDMPEGAFKVHGLSEEFLSDKPLFKDVADEFLEFIQDDVLVIHNAPFDLKFLNHELALIGKSALNKANVADSLLIARKKFPGSPNSLDALCKRFGVDLSKREKHGALLDTELLVDVYVELMGGAQAGLSFIQAKDDADEAVKAELFNIKKLDETLEKRDFSVSQEDLVKHQAFITEHLKSNFWGY